MAENGIEDIGRWETYERLLQIDHWDRSHVVCAWLGNSERIARKHYLQVTDTHFERAIRSGAQGSMAETGGNVGKATE